MLNMIAGPSSSGSTPASTSHRDAVTSRAASDGILLAEADEADLAKTLDLARDAFPDPHGWWTNPTDTAHYTGRLAELHRRNLKCVVAKTSGDVVGYIFYQPQRRGSEIYIKEVAASPAHSGRGLGTLLLGFAVGEAKDNGRSAAKLYTAKGDTTKQGFYTQFSFARVPTRSYTTDGYTTDGERPDRGSVLFSGDVNVVWDAIARRLRI